MSEKPAHADTPTPRQAWLALKEGNLRFRNELSLHPRMDGGRRMILREGQNPKAVVLACSDSRSPVELIFDQGLGDLFVIRTAGEITDPSVLASLEYAVDTLEVPLVVVLGHEACGAIATAHKALTTGELPDGFQRVLVEKVTPSLLSAKYEGLESIDDFERHHVREIAHHLIDRSPQLQHRVWDGRCSLVGMRYSIESGETEPLISFGLDIDEVPENQRF